MKKPDSSTKSEARTILGQSKNNKTPSIAPRNIVAHPEYGFLEGVLMQ